MHENSNHSIRICSSSLIGRSDYLGFFIDWLVECLGTVAEFEMIIVSGSIYVGIFMYIDAMVSDIRMRFKTIADELSVEAKPSLDNLRLWSAYVREIDFHIEIIR